MKVELRGKIKSVFFYLIIVLIPLLFFELIAAYYLTQSNSTFKPALVSLFSKLKGDLNKQILQKEKLISDYDESKVSGGVFRVDDNNNPFMANVPDNIQVRFHPFLDYTNMHSASGSGKNDFFGYRNHENLYFTARDKNDILIVMTGGSECAGYSHPQETILENLKKKLQLHTKRPIKILNLCMNSYTLANEIQSFVHLAYDLKPNLVISHSSWNDVVYGLLISKEFLKVGLIYNKWQEFWLEKLYGTVKIKSPENWLTNFDATNTDMIPASYWSQISKYIAISEASGSKLLIGLQGYNKKLDSNDALYPVYKVTHSALKTISNSVPKPYNVIDFGKLSEIKFVDSCHSSQESVDVIGSIYSEFILSRHADLFLSK